MTSIPENLITLASKSPYVKAAVACADQKSILNEIYKSDDLNKVEKAKKLFIETKADQAALNLVKKYSDLAIKSMDDLDVNQSNKQELIDLSQLLVTRKF